MISAVVFIACSLDGYIARADGALDWLPQPTGGEGVEDYGFAKFFATVDTMVMGRNTFEQVLGFGDWFYADKRVVVLSSQPVSIPPELAAARVEASSLAPAALLSQLAEQGQQRVYVDGGRTIQSFLAAGLIDELVITRVPVLLGEGIPLFGDCPEDIHLRHLATQSWDDGLVQSRYEVRREA